MLSGVFVLAQAWTVQGKSVTVPLIVICVAIVSFLVGAYVGRASSRRHHGNRRPNRGPVAAPQAQQAQQRRESDDSAEIYVGNLDYEVDEEELGRLFSKYGKVAGVRIIQNKLNGRSKGYGFVEMPNRSEAEAAVKAMNGADIRGRKLVVNQARSRARD